MSDEKLFEKINENLTFLTSLNNDNVRLLFEKIDNYSKKNYFPEMEDDKYYIKYKNEFYAVGFLYGPEVLYYIKKEKGEIKSFLDYDYLKYNYVPMEKMNIKNRINEINSDINKLKNDGVSPKILKRVIKL